MADSSPTGPDRPTVGVVAGWFDPESPSVWSGVTKAAIDQLRARVHYAGVHTAMPLVPPARAIHWIRSAVGRAPYSWTLAPEMRLLASLTEPIRRRSTPPTVDGWIHICGGYGRTVSGRYVALGEIPPSVLRSARWGGSFGYRGSTRRQQKWVAAKHAAVYRGAHACCVTGRWSADGLIRDGVPANRVRVVGCGTNLALAPPEERDWSHPRFLFVGWDWARKNGDAVVRAFTELRAAVPSAHLDVVGHHPPIKVEGVTGHGPLSAFDPSSRPALESLFLDATAFVMPSLLEPLGIVYAEAAAAGIASIGTTNGGAGDIIGDAGMLVDPEDSTALTRAMRELSDPDTARALGARAAAQAGGRSWALVGQRVLRALDLDWPGQSELADFL